ncbi:MAG TPA: signal peptidase I [Kofleriaceae bacterium]
MTGAPWSGSVLLTLMFPGFGQGLARRRARMLGWALGTIVTTLAIVWSVWWLPVALAVRIGAAIDAGVVLRRHAMASDRVLAAIAVVIGAISGGSYRFALETFKIPTSSMYPTLVIGDHLYVDELTVRWQPPERGEIIVFDQPCAHRPYVKRVIAVGGDTVEVRCNYVYVNGTRIPDDPVQPHTSYRDYDEMTGKWIERRCSRYRETHGGHTYDVFHDEDRPERDRASNLERGDAHDFPDLQRMIAPSCQQGDFYAPKPGAAQQPIGQLVVTKRGAQPCEQQAHFVVPEHSLFVMGDNRNNANDSRYWGVVTLDAVIGRAIGIWLTQPPHGSRSWSRFGAVH